MVLKYIILICPLVSLMACQLLKILVAIIKHEKVTFNLIVSSGGFPSVHSSFVSALVTVVGLVDGIDSSTFDIALVFGLITCYDAFHVRYESGMHAKLLNKKYKLNMNENLGHKLHEVIAGIILGIIITLIIYFA